MGTAPWAQPHGHSPEAPPPPCNPRALDLCPHPPTYHPLTTRSPPAHHPLTNHVAQALEGFMRAQEAGMAQLKEEMRALQRLVGKLAGAAEPSTSLDSRSEAPGDE
jgi:hypothetical protein